MSGPELAGEQDPRQQMYERIHHRIGEQAVWVYDAAVEVTGDSRAVVEETFQRPPEVRDDAPTPDWTSKQTSSAREIAARFGYGAEQNVPSGLSGGVRITEGGKVWKIIAETRALDDEEGPNRIIFAGSPFRHLGDDEKKFIADEDITAGRDADTEYDFAYNLAASRVEGDIQPETAPYGYEVAEGNPAIAQPTGQLVRLGFTKDGKAVEVLKVDRKLRDPANPQGPYDYQPNTAAIMRFVADVLTAEGNLQDPIALMTSNTYASRVIDAVRAGLENDRQFGVAMYGRSTLRAINAKLPAELPLNQLPGDLRSTYDKLRELHRTLNARVPVEPAGYPLIHRYSGVQFMHPMDPGQYLPMGPG